MDEAYLIMDDENMWKMMVIMVVLARFLPHEF